MGGGAGAPWRTRLPAGVRGLGRSPWHLLVAALVCGSAVATGLAVAGNRDDFPSTRFAAIASAAWLPSDAVGQVSLVDGQAADTLAQVDVAADDTPLDVAQADSDAYAVDGNTGLVTRIDGGSLGTASALPLGHRTGLHVYAGADSVVVHDPAAGLAATLDAATLALRTQAPLPATGTEGAAAADDAGRLWAVGQDGHVLSLDGSGLHPTAVRTAHPADARLVLVRGRPVLVDGVASAALAVDPGTGLQAEASCLPPGSRRAAVSGSPSRGWIYLTDSAAGALRVADLDEHSCAQGVAIAQPGADLGPALEVGDLLLVADRTTSTVTIVDSRTWTTTAVKVPVPAGHPLHLLRHAGAVFYNDPQSEQAGVIGLDGRVHPARKYDPTAPGRGLKTLGEPHTSTGRTVGVTTLSTASATVPSGGTTPTPSAPPAPARAAPQLEITLHRPPAPEVGRAFTFGLLTHGNEQPVSAVWSFGDGSGAGGLTARHTYTSAGPYLVSAVVRLADGRTGVATYVLTVRDGQAVQIVDISPDSAQVGQPTPFSATFTGGTPRAYEWRVLDPTGAQIAASSQAEPVFTFPASSAQRGGPYRVVLRVDGDASASTLVVVGSAAPTATWVECQPSTVETGGQVSCTASATGSIRSWEWTLNGPHGRQTHRAPARFSTLSFAFTADSVGTYQVSVVPVNEAGRGQPARTSVSADSSAAVLSVACAIDPLHVDRPTACTITVHGWSPGAVLGAVWSVDGTGNNAGDLSLGGTQVRDGVLVVAATLTPPAAGIYRVHLEYTDARGAHRSLDSSPLSATSAAWTLVLSVHGDGAVSDGERTCRSDNPPCEWLFDDGARVVLQAQLGPHRTGTWGGDCAGQGGAAECVLTMTSSHSVDLTIRTGPTGTPTTTSGPPTTTTGTHTTPPTTTTRKTTRKTSQTTHPSPTTTRPTTGTTTGGPPTTTATSTKSPRPSRSTKKHRTTCGTSGCAPTQGVPW